MLKGLNDSIRLICLALLVCASGCVSALSSMKPGKMEWIQPNSESPRAGNVYLIRGFIGMFSGGIDTLTTKIDQAGIRSHVFQEDQNARICKELIAKYQNAPDHEPLVLIGHSLGADDAVRISRELEKHNIPVDLLITLDATQPPSVPKNVKLCYNYYQPSIFDGTGILRGIPLQQDPGSTGKLYNLNVRKERKDLLEWDTNHVNIDKNSKIHKDIIARVYETCPPREQWVAMRRALAAGASPTSQPAQASPAPSAAASELPAAEQAHSGDRPLGASIPQR